MEHDDTDTHQERARTHLVKGEYEQAILELTEAIQIDSEEPELYRARAACYRAVGDEASAARDTSKAQELSPRSPPTVHNYLHEGRHSEYLGDYDRAIALYTEAIRFDPEQPWAYRDRGDAYTKKGEPGKAAADYAVARRLERQRQLPVVLGIAIAIAAVFGLCCMAPMFLVGTAAMGVAIVLLAVYGLYVPHLFLVVGYVRGGYFKGPLRADDLLTGHYMAFLLTVPLFGDLAFWIAAVLFAMGLNFAALIAGSIALALCAILYTGAVVSSQKSSRIIAGGLCAIGLRLTSMGLLVAAAAWRL